MDMDTDMVITATTERGKPKQLLLLNQDTITMDTAIMEDTATMDIMERERLKPLLLLSQDTTTMDTAIMEDTATMDIMERERLKPLLNQDTITMDTAIMEDTATMDTAIMEDMVTMAIMERERLNPVIIIMAMDTVMDTMVKQQLFIDSSIFSIIDLDFLRSSQQKHTIIKNKQNSLFEKIKKMKPKN